GRQDLEPKQRGAAGSVGREFVDPGCIDPFVVPADRRDKSPGDDRQPVVNEEIRLGKGSGADRAVRTDPNFCFQKDPVVELEEEVRSELAEVESTRRRGTSGTVGGRGRVAEDLAVTDRE